MCVPQSWRAREQVAIPGDSIFSVSNLVAAFLFFLVDSYCNDMHVFIRNLEKKKRQKNSHESQQATDLPLIP